MSEQDTGLRHAVASDVTRDAFDENLTFRRGWFELGAKRWHSTGALARGGKVVKDFGASRVVRHA